MVNRSLTNPDEVARLRSNAEAAGLDLDHHWANRMYSFNVQTALTHIGGDTAAINRAQLASARYYQRPGRTVTTDGLFSTTLDPIRRDLYGYGFYARLAKETATGYGRQRKTGGVRDSKRTMWGYSIAPT